MNKTTCKDIKIIGICATIVVACIIIMICVVKQNDIKFVQGEVGTGYKYITNTGEYNIATIEGVTVTNDMISIVVTADKSTFIEYMERNGFALVGKNDRPVQVEVVELIDMVETDGNMEILLKKLENKDIDGLVLQGLDSKKYTKFSVTR